MNRRRGRNVAAVSRAPATRRRRRLVEAGTDQLETRRSATGLGRHDCRSPAELLRSTTKTRPCSITNSRLDRHSLHGRAVVAVV